MDFGTAGLIPALSFCFSGLTNTSRWDRKIRNLLDPLFYMPSSEGLLKVFIENRRALPHLCGGEGKGLPRAWWTERREFQGR